MEQKYPGQAGRYHSQMEPDAKKAALDEGFDIPSANMGIILSSSSVERQRIQRLGRILRRCEDNRIAGLYYYLYAQRSSERPDYIEKTQQGKAPVFSLSFDSVAGQFCHPAYEELSVRVPKNPKKQGKKQAVTDECRQNRVGEELLDLYEIDGAALIFQFKKTLLSSENNYVCQP